MSRLKLTTVFSIAVMLAGAIGDSGQQPRPVNPLTPESYSLYSTIYRSRPSSELLGISATPLSFPSGLTRWRPSTPEELQLVEDAKNQLVGAIEWRRQFDFGRAYSLIPATEVAKANDCIHPRRGSAAGCKPYAKLQHVRSWSIPIFNKDRTRALVAMSRSCGGECGDGGVFVYHKTAGGWEREKNSFAECRWVF